ncbi:hypothetical protein BACCIP111883_01150 [Sutcliffiella rhizosphaerae]|uniref:Nitroreductase domain-containing protein n=1 Tax=Sutcliffiella rhizosphaerae TaxID=2880967 RepID=A0ABN8A9S7_9BACI|nr:hypothetical protein BACCIP111883_01150 [Sutcliffiella rhizosphaerae]
MEKKKSNIAEIIRERRSIKAGYTDKEVTEETVLGLLDDAIWAPNHGLREPWRFIFVSSSEKQGFVEDLVKTFPAEMQENRRNYFSQPAAFPYCNNERGSKAKAMGREFWCSQLIDSKLSIACMGTKAWGCLENKSSYL